MIFLISQSTREELIDIMNATRNGVLSTGAVLTGTMGPRTGTVDIGEYADSYYFRVILAGVSSDERDFSCDIEPNGTVLIKGILKTGEKIVCRNYEMFHMLTQNVGHPGPFTISFQLPGLVYPQQVISNLADGILEVSVKKRVKVYVISSGGKEGQDKDNAFVVLPTFSKDQISDLPETFPPNSNTQFRGNRRERRSDEEDNDKEKRNSIGQVHHAIG